MNKLTSLTILLSVFALAMMGCSMTDPITQETSPESLTTTSATDGKQTTPTTVANGDAGTSRETPVEVPEPKRMEVPRVNQAKVIGVVRELTNSGCIVQSVGTIDGIHFSQLKVTCGAPQAIPGIE